MSVEEFNKALENATNKVVVNEDAYKNPNYKSIVNLQPATTPVAPTEGVVIGEDVDGSYDMLTPLEVEYQEKGWL